MRTTVNLDEDILRVAKHIAEQRDESLGRVLSELIRRGLQPARKSNARHGGIPVLPRKFGARPVSSQDVNELLQQD